MQLVISYIRPKKKTSGHDTYAGHSQNSIGLSIIFLEHVSWLTCLRRQQYQHFLTEKHQENEHVLTEKHQESCTPQSTRLSACSLSRDRGLSETLPNAFP